MKYQPVRLRVRIVNVAVRIAGFSSDPYVGLVRIYIYGFGYEKHFCTARVCVSGGKGIHLAVLRAAVGGSFSLFAATDQQDVTVSTPRTSSAHPVLSCPSSLPKPVTSRSP